MGEFVNMLPDLEAIGFTEYEARVYIALLSDHPASGYQISKKAGVPRSMVYEALGRLHARGAVLRSDDRRATLYRPVPPDVLLDRFAREYQDRIGALKDGMQALYAGQNGDNLWTIRGRNAVQSYCLQMIVNSQDELMAVLPDEALEALRQDIQSTCQRGVRVSALLTGVGNLSCGEIARHPPLESELQGLDNMLVLVADSQECLIANMALEVSATITTNPNLVLITRQFIWMELFAQRIYARLGRELLNRLDAGDRRIFESFSPESSDEFR